MESDASTDTQAKPSLSQMPSFYILITREVYLSTLHHGEISGAVHIQFP